MYKGSCLCGDVEYTFDHAPIDCCYCHCKVCLKLSGSAGSAYGSVARDDFTWSKGESCLALYQPSSASTRYFCRRCCTFLLTEHIAEPVMVFISLGTLDTDIDVLPQYHQYVQSLPRWAAIADNLPHHDAWPVDDEV